MFRVLYTVLLSLLIVFALSVFLTPFGGEFATREYQVFNQQHRLPVSICPHPEQTPVVSRSLLEHQSNLLRTVCHLFQNRKITFFAFGETLIGATEVQGPLPWSDRNDLVILLMDLHKLVRSRPQLEEKGLLLLREKHGYRICTNNWKRFPFVFVNIMHRANETCFDGQSQNGSSKGRRPRVFDSSVDGVPSDQQSQNEDFDAVFDSELEDEDSTLVFDSEEEKKLLRPLLSSTTAKEAEAEVNGADDGMHGGAEPSATIAICTPLNEINEPTWNGPFSSFQFAQEDVFPLQIQKYANFSLPVPKNAHKVLSKMPGSFGSSVPENDLDVLFKNSNIQSLGQRVKNKVFNLVGYD